MRRASGLLFVFLSLAACSVDPMPVICTASGVCEEAVAVTSARHTTAPIDYPDPPPAGGDHSPCWTNFGVHTTEVADENWVHNLEHGGVVFLYACPTGCAAEQSALEAMANGRPFAVVTPYAEMTAKFAVVAWGHRLVSNVLDLDAFEAFYTSHVDRAPESSSYNPPVACIGP